LRDTDSALGLELSELATDSGSSPDFLPDHLGDLPLVAEVRGELIGLAWGRIDPSDPEAAALYQMLVTPAHRRLGAGQMLVEAVIAWARARNASYLDLGVTCGDSSARRLYERAGFRPLGEPQALRLGSELMAQPMRLALRGA